MNTLVKVSQDHARGTIVVPNLRSAEWWNLAHALVIDKHILAAPSAFEVGTAVSLEPLQRLSPQWLALRLDGKRKILRQEP